MPDTDQMMKQQISAAYSGGSVGGDGRVPRRPQVGDTIHFYTTDPVRAANGQKQGPYAAMVLQAWNGPYVNILVFPPFGETYHEGSVAHRNDAFRSVKGTELPARWWEWPHGV